MKPFVMDGIALGKDPPAIPGANKRRESAGTRLIYTLAHASKEAWLAAFRAAPDWVKAKTESEKKRPDPAWTSRREKRLIGSPWSPPIY